MIKKESPNEGTETPRNPAAVGHTHRRIKKESPNEGTETGDGRYAVLAVGPDKKRIPE